jgi:hypothetical protein
MQIELKQEPTAVKKKGGRPAGFSPKAAEPKQELLEDDGDYVVVRIKKKELAKLLLRDLI